MAGSFGIMAIKKGLIFSFPGLLIKLTLVLIFMQVVLSFGVIFQFNKVFEPSTFESESISRNEMFH